VTVFGVGVASVPWLLGVVVTGGGVVVTGGGVVVTGGGTVVTGVDVVATGGLVELGVDAVVREPATDLRVVRCPVRSLLGWPTGFFCPMVGAVTLPVLTSDLWRCVR
jgi:hypothetical protein